MAGKARGGGGGNGNEPLVQIMSFLYYCNEDEDAVVDIMRAGDLSQASEMCFQTRDLSAKAGVTYEPVKVRVCFEAGEDTAHIVVPIIQNDMWDTTTEFKVELCEGGLDDDDDDDSECEDEVGLENCQLGRYLWTARVKIIDNDCFPSNKHEEYLREACDVENAPHASLFWEFVKLNTSTPQIWERSLKVIAINFLGKLYGFLHLFVNVYLVDTILDPNAPTSALILVRDKPASLLLVVAFLLIPNAILHWLDARKSAMYGVGGRSRQRLQICLLRKFLNYDHASRLSQSNGDLIMAMTRDSALLVGDGYANILVIINELSDLLLMLLYQFIAPVVFGKKFSWLGFAPLLLFPVCMLMFLRCRSGKTGKCLDERNDTQNSLVEAVDETVELYRLIADYSKREKFIKRFEAAIGRFNKASNIAGQVLSNNAWFAKWLSAIFIAGYTAIGGGMVVEGEKSLGMFLANISIFAKIGAAWGAIYMVVMEIMTIFPALLNITRAMNLPADLPVRKALTQSRRDRTAALREELRSQSYGPGQLSMDLMDISIGHVPFTYNTKSSSGVEKVTSLNQSGMLTVRQGEIAVLLGPTGGGKTTLLKIIGGEILPDPDAIDADARATFFVPSHLRVLHVTEPLFFDGTLLQNLTFGVNEGDDDANVERVAEVCKILGVEDDVAEHIHDESLHSWSDIFSKTQCQLLSVARALVANPEVLCIHKPTQIFGHQQANQIMSVLADFVKLRGIHMGEAKHASQTRRPRTLLTTSGRRDDRTFADRVFHVSREWGIKECKPSEYPAFEEGFDKAVQSMDSQPSRPPGSGTLGAMPRSASMAPQQFTSVSMLPQAASFASSTRSSRQIVRMTSGN